MSSGAKEACEAVDRTEAGGERERREKLGERVGDELRCGAL
jgi:hypothetical protein